MKDSYGNADVIRIETMCDDASTCVCVIGRGVGGKG
jgi:hypothetical protein